MSVLSDDGEEDFDYDSDAGFDSDDGANALLEDDDDAPMDRGKQAVREVAYESLSPEQMEIRIDRDVERVVALIGCKSPTAKILLCQHRWNVDRLIDKYMDSPTQTLHAAGEPANANMNIPTSPTPPPAKRARYAAQLPTFTCEICFDEPSPEGSTSLRCGHKFCNNCWDAYASTKIKDEGKPMIACMSEGCQTIMDEPTLQKVVDPKVYQRWKTLLIQNYVAAHPGLRFCPHPSCTQTISCPSAKGSALLTIVPTVVCASDHTFCAGCGLDTSHRPLICKLAIMWIKNAREDAGTSQWIKANTRACPKCQGVIEKGGGCNRMRCSHCQFQFCWMCMRDWDVHGYNDKVCSTWKEPELSDDMTEAKRNLDKWLFYFDRFNNHELSTKLDEELVDNATARIKEVQDETGMSWIEAQYMHHAVEELSKCRSTLKWTYATAHFLALNNDKTIFEDIQSDLEAAVEQLSQLLQDEIKAETIKEHRKNTINKTVYVRQRHDLILSDTAKRLQDGTCTWNISIE